MKGIAPVPVKRCLLVLSSITAVAAHAASAGAQAPAGPPGPPVYRISGLAKQGTEALCRRLRGPPRRSSPPGRRRRSRARSPAPGC